MDTAAVRRSKSPRGSTLDSAKLGLVASAIMNMPRLGVKGMVGVHDEHFQIIRGKARISVSQHELHKL